jgi:hypothetical protein
MGLDQNTYHFYHERVLNFVKGFFYVYWENHVVFEIASVYLLYYIYGFTDVESSLHPCNEIDLVMVYDRFHVLFFCQCFIANLCIYTHERYWSIILFSGYIFIGILNEYNAGFTD